MQASTLASQVEPAIDITGVKKWYGAFHVLKGVDLQVGKGETVVVCGPSGSGKSTLIRCVNGLEKYQEGTITVNGLSVADKERNMYRIRRQVGMVFQQFHLFPHLTAVENCMLAPRWNSGIKRDAARELSMAMLKRVQVDGHANKYPSQLSGGQQQRVAIARAMCLNPSALLFDEPTSALDPEMVKEVLDVMVALANDGMTMICVTHEMGFARRVADRVVFMDHGEIVEVGSPEQVFGAPQHARTASFIAQIIH
ncbi:amino acid ABC transporter ATP-binding protein [Paraburkholderia sp. MM6662-R1]|uniref:amino acid ABC transporter ATP-binding protein n=1 Tax=Paraburkholderia sp. MM6662-R1 TaxID=2991066 RepID=UPI003D20AE72